MKKLALGSAIIVLMQAGVVQAQDGKPCITVPQAEALVTYLLPKAVEASRSKCGTTLPATSALMLENSQQLASYKAASESAWPKAKEAVGVIAGDKLPSGMSDELMRPIADAIFTQMISEEVKPKNCLLINKIYSDLSPMPSSNIASLTITIVQAATKDDKDENLPICKGAV